MKKSRLSGGSSKSYERRRLRWKWKTCLSARVLQVFFGGRDVQASHVQAPTLRSTGVHAGQRSGTFHPVLAWILMRPVGTATV